MSISRAAVSLMACALTAGCVGLWPHVERREARSVSLVDYLYPGGQVVAAGEPEVAHLTLPLRVGLAFLPDARRGGPDANRRARTLERVREAFVGLDYVSDIHIIPEHYVHAQRGVGALSAVARLYDVDVIALVGFDQVARSRERDSAVLYWTLVGAYVVKGTEHRIHTMIDTAVLDVASGRLLLRAPGFSERSSNVTLSDSRRELAHSADADLDAATDDMIAGLALELSRFETRLADGAADGVVAHWQPGSGGGAGGPWTLVTLLVVVTRRWASVCKR